MANLTLDLAAFKAAGVYTLEIDNSETQVVESNSLRLAVGFNETGPFNVPVYLTSKKEKDKVYGTPNTKLEHRGCYFNRSLETLLETSPVFALNLINVNQNPAVDQDMVNYACFSVDASKDNPVVNNDNSDFPFVGEALYADMYDKKRFWTPSTDNLLSVAAQGVTGSTQENDFNTNLLTVGNCGTKTFSVIVRKAETLTGYDVTAKVWYEGEKNIPFSWIHPNDYISDYFIQVIAIEGDWSDYKSLSEDPYWETFFDASGLIKSKINSFLAKTGVNLIGSWTGSIIPDFFDKMGNPQYIESKVNMNSQTTGVLISVNEQLLETTSYDKTTNTYVVDMDDNGTIDGSAAYHVDLVGSGIVNASSHVDFLSYTIDTSNIISTVAGVSQGDSSVLVECSNIEEAEKVNVGSLVRATGTTNPLTRVLKKTFKSYSPDKLKLIQWRYDTSAWVPTGILASAIDASSEFVSGDSSYIFINGIKYKTSDLSNTTAAEIKDPTKYSFYPKSYWKIDPTTKGKYDVDSSSRFTGNDTVGWYSKAYCYTVESEGYYVITCADSVDPTNGSIEVHKQLTDSSVSYSLRLIPLKGLEITSRHMPGYDASGAYNPEEGVKKIYDMLEDEGINRGLCNKQMIDFRYIVDTMGYGLTSESKYELAKLAQQRGKCLAIISAPSAKSFASSTNPYFCDTFVSGKSVKPQFNTKYIPQGGNQDMMASFSYSLASETDGAKFAAYFFPYLTYSVNNKSILFPPAADVANAYIKKFTTLKDQYAIVANLDGTLTSSRLTGVEMLLDDEDRGYLEPFGLNPIISRSGTIMIFGDRLAYQTVKSDFNYIHVREHLNTIELACDSILNTYVFRYNNAVTRADLVSRITPILQGMADSGVIDSNFTVLMDETNNTPEIIRSSYGVIDIGVTFTHGLEKIINRIKVNRYED